MCPGDTLAASFKFQFPVQGSLRVPCLRNGSRCQLHSSFLGVLLFVSNNKRSLNASLELGDLQGRRAEEVQEERPFLFGQEGGGDQVVEACRDVIQLHVAEAASAGGKSSL